MSATKLNNTTPTIKPTTTPATAPTTMSPVIVALDKAHINEALKLADSLDPTLCRVKVGKELFTRAGPDVVRQLQQRGFDVFLDLKFHDIPNTTAQAVLASADMGVWMVNVHTMAGSNAMQLAKSKLVAGNYDTLLIGVTVLTSMDDNSLTELGINNSDGADNDGLVAKQVARLAKLANESGLDGVVCSANEAIQIKALCGEAFKLVTPGIRMVEDSSDDQQRICTPKQALNNGSDYLVIGRSITQAKKPTQKLESILATIR